MKCSHGATAGRVDDEQVFYATSPRPDPPGGDPHDRRRLLPAGAWTASPSRASARRWARRSAGGCASLHNMADFISVCSVSDIPDPGRQVFEVLGRFIAVFHVQGRFYALDDCCTHDGGPLGEGELEGFEIICPRHGRDSTSATAACSRCRPSTPRRRTRSKSPAAKSW